MSDYKMVTVDASACLFVERSCTMAPDDIGMQMDAAFRTVAAFIADKGIAATGDPLAVYPGHDPDKLTFRAGFPVSDEDAGKAEGDVVAGISPAGEVLHFQHKGSYATLADSYAAVMAHLARNGRAVGAPRWEVYRNDPATVASEADLVTDIYITLI